MKPLIKWSGGKQDEIKQIVKHIPKDYDTYIEPFIGGGALFFHLEPEKAIISDVHKELIDFYNAVKDGYSEEIYEYMKSKKNNENDYYLIRNEEPKDYIENAKRFYYLRKTCFRGMLRYNKNGKFNIPFGRYKNYNFEDIKNEKYETLLKKTTIYNKSFEEIFNKYNHSSNFIFLDPPYDCTFTNYGHFSFGKEEHKKLADLFKKTKNKCLMIIGDTEFIRELYSDYIVEIYDKKYRFKLHSGRINEDINNKHLVIKNYK
jgi:DNA adenine methylase